MAMKAFDKSEHVAMANSFSKIFSPGCRLGYLIASDKIMDQMIVQKYGNNIHAPVPQQIICTEFSREVISPSTLKSCAMCIKNTVMS